MPKPTRNKTKKALVGEDKSILHSLAKNINTLKQEHELLRDAESEDESDREKMFDKARDKMVATATKVISLPHAEHFKPHTTFSDRAMLRDINHVVGLRRRKEIGDQEFAEVMSKTLSNTVADPRGN